MIQVVFRIDVLQAHFGVELSLFIPETGDKF